MTGDCRRIPLYANGHAGGKARRRGVVQLQLVPLRRKMQDILEHGIELGRSFIQPRYWGRRGLDYLWSGIGAYLARYPHYRYLFGPVSISGGLPPAARDLLVAFYRLWFPASHPLAASRQPYPASLPDVLAQFGGVDYVDDLTKLKSLLGNLGCGIPPLYKQYSELCEPAACSLSISAAIRRSITVSTGWCWWICVI